MNKRSYQAIKVLILHMTCSAAVWFNWYKMPG